MTADIETTNRQMIPRWRSAAIATAEGELARIKPSEADSARRPVYAGIVEKRKVEWEQTQSLGVASDFIATAIACNEAHTAAGAAKFVLSIISDEVSPLWRLARSCLYPGVIEPDLRTEEGVATQSRLQILKQLVRQYPRSAIAHVDIARLYCLLGQNRQSEESIRLALALAPHDRFVIRSATRFFIHIGKDAEAYSLVRSPSKHEDPWLAAVELAVAPRLGVSPASWKVAKKTVGRSQPSFQTSELRAAFATHLLDSSVRKARKVFADSVVAPTENTIAQIQWVDQNVLHLDSAREVDMYRRSAEATARRLFMESDFDSSLRASVQWFDLEPFSTEAAGFATFVSSMFAGKPAVSRELAERALISNPDSCLLWNNRAFAEISLGQVDDAKKSIASARRFSAGEMDRAVLDATAGLLELRLGRIELAKKLHDGARMYFREQRDADRQLIASYCWCKSRGDETTQLEIEELRESYSRAAKSRSPITIVLRDQVRRFLDSLNAS